MASDIHLLLYDLQFAVDYIVIQMAKVSQKVFSLYSFSKLIDSWKTEKDVRLSSLTPSRSLVINFHFTSWRRPV